ncbi:hypothetical protein [Planctomycetes bacterium K23_9]|uniref:Uncharacterized protein n=1 Tax=Stieleria marina TaxID=1930275 RepID=A0A517NNY4_9BACT|nr:hypothetical protein K239x_07780 [Planctomycetes bacterium K23_9]
MSVNGAPPKRPRDLSYRVVCGMIIAVVVWMLLMPFVPSVAMSTMRRFHLASDSFVLWCVQQPVPSMYNFANQFHARKTPLGFPETILSLDDQEVGDDWRYINHFPTRRLTFADGRYDLLRYSKNQWLEFKTTYRGQELNSLIHAKPVGPGEYEVIRKEIAEDSP